MGNTVGELARLVYFEIFSHFKAGVVSCVIKNINLMATFLSGFISRKVYFLLQKLNKSLRIIWSILNFKIPDSIFIKRHHTGEWFNAWPQIYRLGILFRDPRVAFQRFGRMNELVNENKMKATKLKRKI